MLELFRIWLYYMVVISIKIKHRIADRLIIVQHYAIIRSMSKISKVLRKRSKAFARFKRIGSQVMLLANLDEYKNEL
jgi:hypothetical protein